MTTRTLPCSRMIVALTGFMGCGKSSVGRELSTLLGLPVVDLDQYIVRKAGRSIADIFAEDGESFFRDLETDSLNELLAGKCTPENVLLRRTPPKQAWVPPSYDAEGGTVFKGTLPRQNIPQTISSSSHIAEGGTVFEGTLPSQDNAKESFILSLGGGTIVRPENVRMLKEKCKVFFLRAETETLKLHLGGDQSQRPLLRSGGFEALLQERAPLYTAAADYIIDIDRLSPMQIAGIIANLVT